METIIGKINGVSLECTPSLPIVENMDGVYQFIWDDTNLDNTIWKSKEFTGKTKTVYFRNNRSGMVKSQILEKNGDELYSAIIPGAILQPSGYLYITIVISDANTNKRLLTAEMDEPLSILKSGEYKVNEDKEPYVKSALEKILQNLSDKDQSTEDMILTKMSKEDYDFGWSDKFEGTSRHIFTENSETGTILGSYFVEEIKDEEGNLIGEKTKVGRTNITYKGNTLTGNLVGNTEGFHTGDVKGDVEGNLTGNADTATRLQNPPIIKINSSNFLPSENVFTGSEDITFNLEFDETKKIPASILPDFVLGQMVYGGTFNTATYIVTFTKDAQSKLGTTETTSKINTDDYYAHEGIYYIVEADGSFANLEFKVGDWLISTETSWKKIDNTDQVTSVNGYIGQVNLVAKDVGSYTSQEIDTLISNHNNAIAHPNGISGNAATATKAFSADTAEKLTNIRSINGINFDGTTNIGNFGICFTARTDPNKTVNIPNYVKQVGSLAIITFDYLDNSSNLTLNISNTGAAPIYSGGVPIGTGRLKAGYSYIFVYDGNVYNLISALESCTEESKLMTYASLTLTNGEVLVPNEISDNEGWDRAIMVFDQLGNYMKQDSEYTIYSENGNYYIQVKGITNDTAITICFFKTSAIEDITLEAIEAVLDNDHQLVSAAEKEKWNTEYELTLSKIEAVLDSDHQLVTANEKQKWNTEYELTLSKVEAVLDSDHQLVTAAEKEKWNKGITEQEGLWIFDCGTSTKNL